MPGSPAARCTVHERCNLGARHRWGIEANFLVEKHQGYHYGHTFAPDWNAMRGYHYLMHMAHLLNTLARFSRHLAAPWLDPEQLRDRLNRPFQLQLE